MQQAKAHEADGAFPLNGAVSVALVCALILLQGGYYAGATCVIGVIAVVAYAVLRIAGKAPCSLPWQTAPLFVLALLYLVSAIAHGATLTMLQEAATWFAVAGMSLWCVYRSKCDRGRTLDVLASAGAALATGGILMFAGLMPIEGSVNAGRLMFTLQYANTAGLLFAVFAVLCLCSASKALRIASIVPIAALALTRSVGALAVFVLALVFIVAMWVKDGVIGRIPAVCIGAAVIVACVVVAVVFSDRIAQAGQTFIERIVQMCDAAGLLVGNLALGIGPDQWQFAYPFVQTAQYHAADVHCSYLQMTLDAGVLAPLLIVAMLAYGMRRLWKQRAFAAVLCVGMVAVHALFDFDLQFASIVVLLAVLLANPADENDKLSEGLQGTAGKAVCWVVAACAVGLSCFGVFLDTQAGWLRDAAYRADDARAVELFESATFMRDDIATQSEVCNACFAAGDYPLTIEVSDGFAYPSGSVMLQRTCAYVLLGKEDAALAAMTSALHALPYDADLYAAMRQLIESRGLGDSFIDAFNEEASRANELIQTGRASWLDNQERVDLLT